MKAGEASVVTDHIERFDASGTLGEPEAAEAAMDGMLAHLRWWARVLREARASARDWETAPA